VTDHVDLTLHQRLRILEAGARRALGLFAEAVPAALPIDNPPPAWCAVHALKAALRDAGLEPEPADAPEHRHDDELTPLLPWGEDSEVIA
jgi:hypothetical protein